MTIAGSNAAWFWDHGIHVFPVAGKAPAVPKGTSQFDYRCTRAHAARLWNYGVPLSASLAVLDTDTSDDELWVLQQIIDRVIPDTPFLVETARAFHRYFRLRGPLPKFMHSDGHTLEFRNVGQYVVGPGSMHPSGKKYQALGWSWRWEDIPFFPADFVFDDGSCGTFSAPGTPYEFPEKVYAGERHDQLFRFIRSFKALDTDRETVREIVTMTNAHSCHPPLAEDEEFEKWFSRAWNLPDRPFPPAPLRGLDHVRGL